MNKWNGKRFSIYDKEEKQMLGLVKNLGDQTNYNTDEVERLTISDNKKVSHEEMKSKYKVDENANFTGSWWGIEKPSASNEGMATILNKVVEQDLPFINAKVENNKKELDEKINEVATKGTTSDVLQSTTKTYIDEKIKDGTLPTMTIADNKIENPKYKTNSITLNKCNFIEKSYNLFDKSNKNVKIHHLCDQTGNIVPVTNYYCTDKIYVSPGEKITIRYAEVNMGACFDSNGIFISKIGASGSIQSPFTFTVPNNCSYIIVNGKLSTINTDMIVYGDTYPVDYKEFTGNKISKDLLKSIPSSSLEDLTQNIAFSKYLILNKLGEEGTEIKDKEGCYIFKIPISELKENISVNKLTYSVAVKTSLYRSHRFYDSEMNFISDSGYTPNVTTLTISSIPSNAKYLVINGQEEILKHHLFNMNYGDTLKDFKFPGLQPYLYETYVDYLISNNVNKIVEQLSKASNNPLFGKTIIFDGDSICQGDVLGGWAKRIADKNSMQYTNYGRNGGTITAGIDNRHWVCRSVVGYREDADYVILEGGTNDADLIKYDEMKTGTISNGFNAELDDTTFCGAVESLLKQVILKYNGKKIGFIIAQKMGTFDETLKRRRYYFDLICKMCEKWGVPYIDLWNTSYINPNIDNSSLNYTDGQHLTALGYDIISSQIENWLKTL